MKVLKVSNALAVNVLEEDVLLKNVASFKLIKSAQKFASKEKATSTPQPPNPPCHLCLLCNLCISLVSEKY